MPEALFPISLEPKVLEGEIYKECYFCLGSIEIGSGFYRGSFPEFDIGFEVCSKCGQKILGRGA